MKSKTATPIEQGIHSKVLEHPEIVFWNSNYNNFIQLVSTTIKLNVTNSESKRDQAAAQSIERK